MTTTDAASAAAPGAPAARVLDFYSGIGGMHHALLQAHREGLGALVGRFEVLDAFDVNTTANTVYQHNLGRKVNQKGIDQLTPAVLDQYRADLWVCSPPCQPYTSQGNRLDTEDPRAASFLHLLDCLGAMQHPPGRILVENVKGFEVSKTFEKLVATLQSCGMTRQVHVLSPTDLGIPNSRRRVFVLAQSDAHPFGSETVDLGRHAVTGAAGAIAPLSEYLEEEGPATGPYLVLSDVLDKYGRCVDVVQRGDTNSCCFTKNYFRYVDGTGSLLQTAEHVDRSQVDASGLPSWLPDAKVRYFTPTEVARLHYFPPSFQFPEGVTARQKYQLLGNSLNVHVVASLVKHMYGQ